MLTSRLQLSLSISVLVLLSNCSRPSENTKTQEATVTNYVPIVAPDSLFGVGVITDTATEDLFYVTKSFIITHSYTEYNSALQSATEVSENLGYELRLDLFDSLACGCGEIHGHTPRGRYDDGEYVCIEASDSYTAFTGGLFIVIAASGQRDALKSTLKTIKDSYPEAYMKDAKVYVGCLH